MVIKNQVKPRIGLVGNPSDGYYGKTIAFLFNNFSAQTILRESPQLQILPNQQDCSHFKSIRELVEDVDANGYYGGIRLIKATIKKFSDYCCENNLTFQRENFTIQYETNIPRGVGLAGSSAIITSTLKSLMQFYKVYIPLEIQPNLILSVEKDELKIQAGLQDRVVQALGGIVYMDFSREIMEKQGYGKYEIMKVPLPDFFLAYLDKGEESNKFHSNLRYRYERGERDIIEAMKEFASLTVKAKKTLERGDYLELGKLINANFDLRREIMGDKVIGEKNIEMVEIARKIGSPAKFSGSGGAVVGLIKDNFPQIKKAYQSRGFNIIKVEHSFKTKNDDKKSSYPRSRSGNKIPSGY